MKRSEKQLTRLVKYRIIKLTGPVNALKKGERLIEDLLANLDEEKKTNIINSAMKEFSKHSFQNASTNTIVKDAGISKGALYHYFGTKKKLYEYLEYYVIQIISEKIVKELNWEQKDIFIRIKEISLIKFKLFQELPYLSDFSLKVFENKTAEEIIQKHPNFPLALYSQIYTQNIDYSLFKESVNEKKAIDIIRWTIEKCGDEYRKKIAANKEAFNYKAIEKEIYSYIDILKDSFYKKEAK
ncbi:MAG: TetR/AcrR family transcriptional regulator [Alkalibacterium sp.]|uniref:TetR/AcrR family transcriptional regulator n=1 Tax=Alkalibacterium sp. TaxID=1872447 RepID=UPI002647B00D|nr:TetR/AcrR family transcriptional regulator [Alkalibacterium sp.]MDN6293915.1 TetR/AcrR family transcriptional regulator [Alkalibacterium sp.]MDN6295765.1 TetR/AcrR family transcriptional regulator [Alkalibacterium sp.]MDN6729451.1 TetR/AcrR family transcriptional regulator [Alkalibacterium sp.]